MSAATGIIYLDFLVRPFLKVAMKFPAIGLFVLFVIYAAIGYVALKSAFLSDHT
ncbi:MAG: hypothetical protein J0M35_14865 [Candidatus Obscuribacter phosphatis]|uniref:Uncharacterized protein n=1 Tax=Candidatus Obscuribacter phosphatis TaxID=1906157 RepID=A0A8J7TM15_9BACT|nr:hypothetical protein [Candidatus Obscuribacter phosphatis]